MQTILMYVQIGSAIALVITILLQQRGEGLSGGMVGSSLEYSTRRGVQKGVFVATIVLAAIFLSVSIARLLA
jgi:preprotein translocase subunit SecG